MSESKKGGRKPLEGGRKTAAYVISASHADAVERYRASNGLRSASEAIRQIIEKTCKM